MDEEVKIRSSSLTLSESSRNFKEMCLGIVLVEQNLFATFLDILNIFAKEWLNNVQYFGVQNFPLNISL